MSAQTGYLGLIISDNVTNFGPADPGTIIFDSTAGDYPPAVGMRFQLQPGTTESCYIHIDGFHSKNGFDEEDSNHWDKSIVGASAPLDIIFRNPSRLTEGLITNVRAWSDTGAGVICWTPIAKF